MPGKKAGLLKWYLKEKLQFLPIGKKKIKKKEQTNQTQNSFQQK